MAGVDSVPGYREYLERVQSKRKVSSETLVECLRHVSHSPITIARKLVEGEANEVYDVELADGLAVIVRIAPSSQAVFERERWAIERCIAKNIPVPEILSISRHDSESVPVDVCIQRKKPGRPLSLREDTDPDPTQIVRECGEWLREIHTIKTTGLGYLDADGRGSLESVADEAAEYRSLERGLAAAAKAHRQNDEILHDALEFVERTIKSREVEQRLLHNDFEPKHILVDDEQLTAIIDFGESSSGDPINDLARFSFYESGPVRFDDLMAGYGACDLERLLAYRIGFSLCLVAGCHEKGFPAGVIDGTKRVVRDWRRVRESNESR